MPVAKADIAQIKKLIRDELRKMVREAVTEELTLRMMKYRLSKVKKASAKEQREIEEMFGVPGPKEIASSYTLEID